MEKITDILLEIVNNCHLGSDLHIHLSGCGTGKWWADRAFFLYEHKNINIEFKIADLINTGYLFDDLISKQQNIHISNLDKVKLISCLEMKIPGQFSKIFHSIFELRRVISKNDINLLPDLLYDTIKEQSKEGTVYFEFSLGYTALLTIGNALFESAKQAEKDYNVIIRFLAAFHRSYGIFLNLLSTLKLLS